jgi:hypothetical protein
MDLATPQSLRFVLRYAGQPAGEQRLTLEPMGRGSRLVLEAQVDLPPPRTKHRWESDLDPRGFPRRYVERVEGNGGGVMEVDFSREDGLVVVSQGKDDFAIPYVADLHDPLSLVVAVSRLELEVGGVVQFGLVGGRAYVERLADQTLGLPWGETPVRVYRLRPGLSLLYFDLEGNPVRLTQKVGDHVFEAELMAVEAVQPKAREREGQPGRNRRRRRRRRFE